jgi:hypothetical protein
LSTATKTYTGTYGTGEAAVDALAGVDVNIDERRFVASWAPRAPGSPR